MPGAKATIKHELRAVSAKDCTLRMDWCRACGINRIYPFVKVS